MVLPVAQGTIFGFVSTPVIVWMGAQGFSECQIRAVLNAYEVEVADTTIARARLQPCISVFRKEESLRN
jgi:hypothetical protein